MAGNLFGSHIRCKNHSLAIFSIPMIMKHSPKAWLSWGFGVPSLVLGPWIECELGHHDVEVQDRGLSNRKFLGLWFSIVGYNFDNFGSSGPNVTCPQISDRHLDVQRFISFRMMFCRYVSGPFWFQASKSWIPPQKCFARIRACHGRTSTRPRSRRGSRRWPQRIQSKAHWAAELAGGACFCQRTENRAENMQVRY